jgi:hypothetical protein
MADHSEGAGNQAVSRRDRAVHSRPGGCCGLPRLWVAGGQHAIVPSAQLTDRLRLSRRERTLLPQPRRPSDLGPPRLNGLRRALGGRVVDDAGPMGPARFPWIDGRAGPFALPLRRASSVSRLKSND